LHSVVAFYPGDGNFAGSTSTALSQKVLFATTTNLVSSANPSSFSQAVTLTATITSASGTPNVGTVQFKDGNTSLGSAPVVNGVATLMLSNLAAGSGHSLTATYSGDGVIFAGSSSGVLTQSVTGVNFNVTLSSSAGVVANIGKPIVFTSLVTNQAGTSVANIDLSANITGQFVVDSLTSTVGSCDPVALACAVGTLADGQQATITLTLTPLWSARNLTAAVAVNATTNNPVPQTIAVRPLPFHH